MRGDYPFRRRKKSRFKQLPWVAMGIAILVTVLEMLQGVPLPRIANWLQSLEASGGTFFQISILLQEIFTLSGLTFIVLLALFVVYKGLSAVFNR